MVNRAVGYALSTFVLCGSGIAFALWGQNLPYRMGTFCAGVVFGACLISAVTDYRTRKILNVVTYPAFLILVAALVVSAWTPENASRRIGYPESFGVAAVSSLVGAAFCFAVHIVPFALGQGGAGDVKIAAVIGFGLGISDGFQAMCATYLFACGYALMEIAARYVGRLRQKEKNEPQERLDNALDGDAAPSGQLRQSGKRLTIPVSNELNYVVDSITAAAGKKKIYVPMGASFFIGEAGAALGFWNEFVYLLGLA